MLTVWAIDPARLRRGHLKVTACTAVLRDADVGTYSVTAADDDLAERVRDGWRLAIQDGTATLLSGPVTGVSPDLAAHTVTFSGVSDLIYLEDRLTYPDPAAAAEAQTAAAYYVRTGPAETVIRDLIHLNAGTGALADRQVGGLTVTTSQGRGATVKTNLRMKNLLEEARALGRLGGVTFDAVQEASGQIVVRFRVPRDLSRSVRFTDRNGGVEDGTYALHAPTATTVLVGGQGEGTARTIIERAQVSTWGRRIEVFKDQRDTNDAAQLEQSATEQLAEGAAAATASFSVEESPGRVFGLDFLLGDTVSVDLGAATISEPVRSVELAWDGYGRTASLALGDHDQADDKTPAWVTRIRRLDARVRDMEVQ